MVPRAGYSLCTDGFSALTAVSLNLARRSCHYFSLSAEEQGSLSLSPLVLLVSIFLSTCNWPLVKELQIGYIAIFIYCLRRLSQRGVCSCYWLVPKGIWSKSTKGAGEIKGPHPL